MVCKTLTVGAVLAPDIYIESVKLKLGTIEVTEITYGETVRMTIRLVNAGNAGGIAKLRREIDGIAIGMDANVTVSAGQYIDYEVDLPSTWEPFGLVVGSHNICAEITGYL